MMNTITGVIIASIILSIVVLLVLRQRKKKSIHEKLNQEFPEAWRTILKKDVVFYKKLNEADKSVFEKRVQLFIATKTIEGIETEIDDTIRLMVAASAIIPTFAFPQYNYPHVQSVLIYPNSFSEKYETQIRDGLEEPIIGMVSGRIQVGNVILSKPDLLLAFDGLPHKENVGVHEFIHMLDKEDGEIDGIPEFLLDHRFAAPWLNEIKKEMRNIEQGKSDINPYALTNNAEFLAVVSEYFFDNPDKFLKKHPELYRQLSAIFNRG